MVDDFHMHLHKGKDSLQVILNKKSIYYKLSLTIHRYILVI